MPVPAVHAVVAVAGEGVVLGLFGDAGGGAELQAQFLGEEFALLPRSPDGHLTRLVPMLPEFGAAELDVQDLIGARLDGGFQERFKLYHLLQGHDQMSLDHVSGQHGRIGTFGAVLRLDVDGVGLEFALAQAERLELVQHGRDAFVILGFCADEIGVAGADAETQFDLIRHHEHLGGAADRDRPPRGWIGGGNGGWSEGDLALDGVSREQEHDRKGGCEERKQLLHEGSVPCPCPACVSTL